jgi:hypothetical protein
MKYIRIVLAVLALASLVAPVGRAAYHSSDFSAGDCCGDPPPCPPAICPVHSANN